MQYVEDLVEIETVWNDPWKNRLVKINQMQ